MVFYQKYRPQKIADLDSEQIRTVLSGILSSKNIPHAFLFIGSRGLGKTSTARIVAKVVNCERKVESEKRKGKNELYASIEPCNACESCVSITNGTNIDVLEIDAASNRGIDEIRSLQEKIKLAAVVSKVKVYIIDEVHMLTNEAFNALLKTLEEPPPHAMFILCTTESHKVPETIQSRCFVVSFKRASDEEIIHSLERIVKGETLEIDRRILQATAKRASGSFRDATKLLEQLVLQANGKEITLGLFDSIFGKRTDWQDLIRLLKEKNTKAAIELINTIANQQNIKSWLEDCLKQLHVLLLAKVTQEQQGKSLLTVEEVKEMLEIFSKAYQEMRYAVIPQLPLELAVIEYCLRVKS